MKNHPLTIALSRLSQTCITVTSIFAGLIMIFGATPTDAGSLTMSTFYPAPVGAFDRLQLVPRPLLSGSCEIGTLYYYQGSQSANNEPYICLDPDKNGTGEWMPLMGSTTPVWTQNGNNLYPTDSANPNLRVGIGTTTPEATLHLAKDPPGSFNWDADISLSTAAAGQSSDLEFYRYEGTKASPTAVTGDKPVGEMLFSAYDGTAFSPVGSIEFRTKRTAAPGDTPGYIRFLTTPIGSAVPVERMRITSEGMLGLGTDDPDRFLHVRGTTGEILIQGSDPATGGAELTMVPAGVDDFAIRALRNEDKLRFVTDPDLIDNTGTTLMTLTADARLGIGTDTPESDLHILSSSAEVILHTIAGSPLGSSTQLWLKHQPDLPQYTSLFAFVGTSNRFWFNVVDIDPVTGIWDVTTGPSWNVHGDMGVNSWVDGQNTSFGLTVGGDMRAYNGVYRSGAGGSCVMGNCSSDKRLKKDIVPLSGSLDKIAALQPSTFNFIDETYGKGIQTGLIAQEVEPIFPEWVQEKDNGYKSILYGPEIQVHMIQAVKELKSRTDELDEKVITTENTLKQLLKK